VAVRVVNYMQPSFERELQRSVEYAICSCEEDPCVCNNEPEEYDELI